MKRTFAMAALASMTLAASPALATDMLFTISGDYAASFVLPESPTPDPLYVVDGNNFALTGIDGFPDSSNGKAAIQFFNAAFGGGLIIMDDGDYFTWLLDASDFKQYYSGTESAPTFLAGTYELDGLTTRGRFTLTIAEVDAAVPEPASWALMVGGFALAGSALRRGRAAKVRFAVA